MEIREETRIARGAGPDREYGSLTVPIYRSATYIHPIHPDEKQEGVYTYARCEAPTRRALEHEIACLEHGADALGVSSGMAAISLVARLFVPGDHVIVSSDLYGGTYRLFTEVYGRYGIEFTYVDTWKIEEVKAAVKKNTKAVFIETPTNPCLHVTDLGAVSDIAKAQKALMIVDNTFLSPYFQKPLDLGADIVIHSATKYLAGHNDVLAGLIVTKTGELREKLYFYLMCEGCNLSQDDAWLVSRGMQTLAVRMEKQQKNAFILADFLETLPNVEKVIYTGNPNHPDYELSKKQTTGFGSMITFYMKDGSRMSEYLARFRIINHGGSLGGIQSLISRAGVTLQKPVPEEQRLRTGVTDNLLRLSVGIEDAEDLKEDLEQALR